VMVALSTTCVKISNTQKNNYHWPSHLVWTFFPGAPFKFSHCTKAIASWYVYCLGKFWAWITATCCLGFMWSNSEIAHMETHRPKAGSIKEQDTY
jgi:hypothetical protein